MYVISLNYAIYFAYKASISLPEILGQIWNSWQLGAFFGQRRTICHNYCTQNDRQMKGKQLENKLRKSRLQGGESNRRLWQVKCVLGPGCTMMQQKQKCSQEYSGGKRKTCRTSWLLCRTFCHIFWLISKMQIIDVLAERSTSCRLFDKFAIRGRAAMCSLYI